ncbi:uncharacterized protein ARB_06751 [Trichophyton benhamiae CBS 112371]|uniref:Bacteriophage T5 Orf172 DNA-binding domain-containing protein n=1 Tax=Arthroderma benhamiae (strain ATCC MYA-4681 / CBS 112371) TaxID=663331 RepID=D4ARK8_ARTBC|nr:uncharacterized protein ARB_06751 [Trichophyton benhamiae CBS 112371]EFE34351.1 conserved hypothetical protein [Trichophyton benhamiae CBS 112371]
MSHIRHCPEFQLARSDSKNPATTCQGLTADGRRCRRTVIPTASSRQDDFQRGRGGGGRGDHITIETPGGLFCWQHKTQGEAASSLSRQRPSRLLRPRSSLDTLIERVGMLSVDEVHSVRGSSAGIPGGNADRNGASGRHSADGPYRRTEQVAGIATLHVPKAPKKKSKQRMKFVCFFAPLDSDDERHPVPRRSSHVRPAPNLGDPVPQPLPNGSGRRHARLDHERDPRCHNRSSWEEYTPPRRKQLPPTVEEPSPSNNQPLRQSLSARRGPSQTEYLLSWIPSSLSPDTTSKLLQRLAEPLSPADEAGYIYIYCVTSRDSQPQADETASLIPPSPDRHGARRRRTSDIMSSAGIAPTSRITRHDSAGRRTAATITLKIGRAVNVCRRLTQQCSHNLTLIRYYPYHPSSGDASLHLPQKAPNVHRLERLVHLELADIRVKPGQPCEECGRKHQEYFEIEASREQLRRVDECVRRWVEYSQLNPTS